MYKKLNKCIYSLKQLLQEWYYWLIDFLTPYGFVVSNFDPCILMFKSNNDTKKANNILHNIHYNDTNNVLFITIYINNLLLFRPKGPVMDNLKDLLKSEFKVTDVGNLYWLLGIQIKYKDHDITLSQSAYINTILKRFSLYWANYLGVKQLIVAAVVLAMVKYITNVSRSRSRCSCINRSTSSSTSSSVKKGQLEVCLELYLNHNSGRDFWRKYMW